MICPDCNHDNIDGDDHCDACGQPLANVELPGTELEQTITRETIKILAPHAPFAIEPETTVREAIQSLVEKRIGCLLVESQGELLGIFTERDVVNRISENPHVMDHPVREFMTTTPTTATLDDSIAYALHAMDLGGYRHLPIVGTDGKPQGVISVRDILSFLCDRFAELSPPVA